MSPGGRSKVEILLYEVHQSLSEMSKVQLEVFSNMFSEELAKRPPNPPDLPTLMRWGATEPEARWFQKNYLKLIKTPLPEVAGLVPKHLRSRK
jgi:hypothetical protein